MLTIRNGNALGAKVNVHRAGWNGTICKNPTAWDCGGKLDFRRNYCDRGDSACFHIDLFNDIAPSMKIDQSGADWLLEANIHALDDQIILFYNRAFAEPGGIDQNSYSNWRVFGAYRIKSALSVDQGYRSEWLITPHRDDWVAFPELQIRLPRFESLRGPYLKEVDRETIVRIFAEARQRVAERPEAIGDPAQLGRLEHFAKNLADWLEIAGKRNQSNMPTGGQTQRRVAEAGGGVSTNAFAKLKDLVLVRPEAEQRPPEPAEAKPERSRLIEESRRPIIEENYGSAILQSLDVATLTKPFLILRGGPGVGKSTLATQLIEDEVHKRSIVVPVASTWRGREDLLGYVNPLNGLFEPTALTEFLVAAEKAWDGGDQLTRLIILEELNLSQPEYWLSDVLVRIEYPGHDRARRSIELGGQGVNRKGEEKRTSVYLTPAVRFVATINTDHTTKKLSPRVLDRAAVIELRVDPTTVIEKMGIAISEDQIAAIKELDFLVRRKGAAFSYRSARSLKACLAEREKMGLEVWSVIDLVIVHEVLSKVQLLAGEAGDELFMESAMAWRETFGRYLPESLRVLDAWYEALEEGRDVIQA